MSQRSWQFCSWALGLGGSAVALAHNLLSNVGAISVVGVASAVGILGGVGIAQYKSFNAARIEVAEKWARSDAGKVDAQLKVLQQTVSDGAARVEDANVKLHKMANDAHLAELRHVEEVDRLQAQLKLAIHQLDAARDDMAQLRTDYGTLNDQLRLARDENKALMARMTAKVDQNTSKIEEIRVAHNAGEGGSASQVQS